MCRYKEVLAFHGSGISHHNISYDVLGRMMARTRNAIHYSYVLEDDINFGVPLDFIQARISQPQVRLF